MLARSDARQEAILCIGLSDGALDVAFRASREPGPDDLIVVLEPELRFWVYGHGIEAMSFALMAQAAGYDVTLFGQEGLHSDLSRLGLDNIAIVPSFRSYTCPVPDPRTAITLFFHDHENEARLLAQFLPSDAFFIGAQGSLKARQRLLADLAAAGCSTGAYRQPETEIRADRLVSRPAHPRRFSSGPCFVCCRAFGCGVSEERLLYGTRDASRSFVLAAIRN